MTLPELLRLVETHWPRRLERGRIVHIHANDVPLDDGSHVHLRVLIQTVQDSPKGRSDVDLADV